MSYFNKFPIIEYNGKFVRNITARVALSAQSLVDIKQFQPYDVPQGLRADELSYDYYGSPSQEWLLYIANGVIDPYYDWPLDEPIFDDYIAKKYGSLGLATEGISHFKVNWQADNTVIDPITFNSLSSARKYFWTINSESLDEGIISYKRKPLNDIVNSNKTQELEVSNTANFIVNERIKQLSGLTLTGSAQITAIVNSTSMIVDKVIGTLANGAITGNQSDVSTTITNVNTLTTNIHDDLSIYWQPVTYFEYESELNEAKRTISVIDNSAQRTIDNAVDELLNDE